MIIEVNKVVSFHYRLREEGDESVLEDSYEGSAVVYLYGHEGVLAGLEEAMAGKQSGDKFTVILSPEKAYGSVIDDSIQRVSIKHVMNPGKKKVRYKPGMVVQLNTNEGPREVVVSKVGLKNLDVDTNHPFAGKTLKFDVEVVNVRDASEEEIAHRHVHGEGGHDH